jgi:hypothetical protein
MDKNFEEAIEKLIGSIRTNMKPEDAVKFSQAALNVAHTKQVLLSLNGTKTKGAGS